MAPHINQTAVRLTLAGQEPVNASIFLSTGDRLVDLLNDDRAFIPVELDGGEPTIVAKSQIVSVFETETGANATQHDGPAQTEERTRQDQKLFDPYAVLRVSADAPIEDIHAAYHGHIKSMHPDAIESLGLDANVARAALLALQKLNRAYRRIKRDRAQTLQLNGHARRASG